MNFNCNNFSYLYKCFYIISYYIDDCSEQNAIVNGSILMVLNFIGANTSTKSYFLNYFIVSSVSPPQFISGVGTQIRKNQVSCSFNDSSTMDIQFSVDDPEIGKITIVSPSLCGCFYIVSSDTYAENYSAPPCFGNPTSSLKIT